jgi:hypothetical protein
VVAPYKGQGTRSWRAGQENDTCRGRTRWRRSARPSPARAWLSGGDDKRAPAVSDRGRRQGKQAGGENGPKGHAGPRRRWIAAGRRRAARGPDRGCCCWVAGLDWERKKGRGRKRI